MVESTENALEELHCSFCGKGNFGVRVLVAGVGAFICDECVMLCNQLLLEKAAGLEKPGDDAKAIVPSELALALRAIEDYIQQLPVVRSEDTSRTSDRVRAAFALYQKVIAAEAIADSDPLGR